MFCTLLRSTVNGILLSSPQIQVTDHWYCIQVSSWLLFYNDNYYFTDDSVTKELKGSEENKLSGDEFYF